VAASAIGGRPVYIPPEFAEGEPTASTVEDQARADVWAHGMILFQVLTGKIPYGDIKATVRLRRAIKRGDLPGEIPAEPRVWNGLCKLCLSQKPLDRPEFFQIVRAILDAGPGLLPGIDSVEYSNYVSKVMGRTRIADEARELFEELDEALVRLADAGDPTAQVRVGLSYAVGKGVQKDPAKAVRYFK
jgi:TPR repeat protein